LEAEQMMSADEMQSEDAQLRLAVAVARRLMFGMCDYVVAVSECGMFTGDSKDTEAMKRDINRYGYDYMHRSGRIVKCCTFAVYELAGVCLRAFASEASCIKSYLSEPNMLEFIKADHEQTMSEHIGDLCDDDKWVLFSEQNNTMTGPLGDWLDVLDKACGSPVEA